MMVDRRQKVVRADAEINYVVAATVGRPNDLPCGDAATRPKHGVGLRPVVPARLDRAFRPARHPASAAGLVADPRRPPEFAGYHHQDSPVQAALVDVLDES